jgi:hypothetical protein
MYLHICVFVHKCLYMEIIYIYIYMYMGLGDGVGLFMEGGLGGGYLSREMGMLNHICV